MPHHDIANIWADFLKTVVDARSKTEHPEAIAFLDVMHQHATEQHVAAKAKADEKAKK